MSAICNMSSRNTISVIRNKHKPTKNMNLEVLKYESVKN